jgi:hypothetical protein
LISLNMAEAVHSSLDAQMHLLHLEVRRVRHHVLKSLQQNSPRPEHFPSPNSNTFLFNTDQWFVQKSTNGHKVSIHFNEIATIYSLFQDSLEGCRMQKKERLLSYHSYVDCHINKDKNLCRSLENQVWEQISRP